MHLVSKIMKNVKYSLYMNEFRKNLAAHGKLLLRCSTTYVPIGLAQMFPCYGYASAGDRPILFTIFPLSFVPFMQYAG